MQVMSPHLAILRRAAAWNRRPRTEDRPGPGGALETKAGTDVSFRKAWLTIAAWLLALLLISFAYFQSF